MKRRRMLQAAAAAPWAGGAHAAAATDESAAGRGARTLRLAFATPEVGFDPVQTQSDLNSAAVISQILESPLGYDYLARPVSLVPRTATALPEVSADFRVFTLRLRPGIFFADDPAFGGRRRELVAQDYVYAIKRFYDPRYNSSDLYLFENAKIVGLSAIRQRALREKKPFDYDTEVQGLRAPDRHTLRIELAEPNPRFAALLADPGLTGAVAREVVERYGPERIMEHPVGTGAFRLKRWRRGSRIVLERSPAWRGDPYHGTPADDPMAQAIAASLKDRPLPLVDEVVIDIVEESQPRWLSFLDGTHHWITVPDAFAAMAVPGGRLAPFLQRRGVTLQASQRAAISMVYFYMDDPLVGGHAPEKVALRRAVSLAFDTPGWIRNVAGGQALPAQSTIPPFTSGYDPAYRSEMSEHNPARAMALLDTYGYVDRDGDGWREQPDGKPLVLRMASVGSQRERQANELWKRSMDRVGLRVEFEISTWPELLKRSRAGTLMIWGYSWSASSPDGGFFLGIAYGPNASESNDARFALPAFDRLYERQMRLPDGPEREALMRQAKDLLVAYMPYKVLGHGIGNDLVQPWTRHFWRHPFMRDFWRFIEVQPRS